MNTAQICLRRFTTGCATALLGLVSLPGCQPTSTDVSPTGSAVIDLTFHDTLPSQLTIVPEAGEQLAAAPPSETPPSETPPSIAAVSTPAAAPQGTLNISFDNIIFEWDNNADFKRSLITPEIEKLNGRNIRIRGYILPKLVFSQTGIRFFVLVRDNQACCFGPGAMLYDCVMVYMNPGKSTDFTTGVVTVEGKFSIEVDVGDDGKAQAIYRLNADSAK